jgi:DNA processing protein
MLDPTFEAHHRIAAARGQRGFEAVARGLWCAGSLDGLRRPCVAVVGTRAATPYGRGQARRIAAELGAAGCCIVAGLALGVDAAAHEGALDAVAPTIGVLGGGHHRFYPRRNRDLAERIIAGGGAVLSPFAPDHDARPGQFLERNGVVAALSDALLVVEAPSRSGALNTASWAAPRIPVLAVPGDVDRPHSLGCLALIRDGATLARGAADVLEALGIRGAQAPLPLGIETTDTNDATSAALLHALDAGAMHLDRLVAVSGVGVADALASLALLELRGAVQSRGGTAFARVAVASRGEEQANEPCPDGAARLS